MPTSMSEDVIEQRRREFIRLQHARAARFRQLIGWLGNVSYTVGAVALGDALFAKPRHVAGEVLFGLASLATISIAVMLAPSGEPK